MIRLDKIRQECGMLSVTKHTDVIHVINLQSENASNNWVLYLLRSVCDSHSAFHIVLNNNRGIKISQNLELRANKKGDLNIDLCRLLPESFYPNLNKNRQDKHSKLDFDKIGLLKKM